MGLVAVLGTLGERASPEIEALNLREAHDTMIDSTVSMQQRQREATNHLAQLETIAGDPR